MQSKHTLVVDTHQRVVSTVLECVRQLLPKARHSRQIAVDARFSDLGLDSMRLLELVFLLQDALKIEVDDEEFGRVRAETVADVVASVERLLARRGTLP